MLQHIWSTQACNIKRFVLLSLNIFIWMSVFVSNAWIIYISIWIFIEHQTTNISHTGSSSKHSQTWRPGWICLSRYFHCGYIQKLYPGCRHSARYAHASKQASRQPINAACNENLHNIGNGNIWIDISILVACMAYLYKTQFTFYACVFVDCSVVKFHLTHTNALHPHPQLCHTYTRTHANVRSSFQRDRTKTEKFSILAIMFIIY